MIEVSKRPLIVSCNSHELEINPKKVSVFLLLAPYFFALGILSAAIVILPISSDGISDVSVPLRDEPRTLPFAHSFSLLTKIPLGSEIAGMDFQLNGGFSTRSPVSRAWSGYGIQMSNALNSPRAYSMVFENHIRPDGVTVRSGSLTFLANDDLNLRNTQCIGSRGCIYDSTHIEWCRLFHYDAVMEWIEGCPLHLMMELRIF